jgi:hypothetical protein
LRSTTDGQLFDVRFGSQAARRLKFAASALPPIAAAAVADRRVR